jgi:hypothetical protein
MAKRSKQMRIQWGKFYVKQFCHFTLATSKKLGCLVAGALIAGVLGATAAEAGLITQTDNFGPLSGGGTNLTTGGPFKFITNSPSFNQFNGSPGTLLSATLGWTITGSENGSGNFAGTGVFSYGGQSQTVTFDTVTDPGPKSFDFTGSELLSLATATGTGTFVPSVFNGTMQQSGLFPWAGSMSNVLGTVTLTFAVDGGITSVPEPTTVLIFGSGLVLLGLTRRRRTS